MIEPIVGYYVEAVLDHYLEDDPKRNVSGVVFKVQRRFGKVNGGQDYINPLVYVINDDGLVEKFDASFIVNQVKPDNYVDYSVYNPTEQFDHIIVVEYIINEVNRLMTNTRVQSIASIDYFAMLDAAINNNLFKQYGYIHGLKPHSKKRLRKWVKQNVNRFIQSKQFVDQQMTQRHMEDEDEYWADADGWLDN